MAWRSSAWENAALKFVDDDTVQLLVGANKERLRVHKSEIAHASTFFLALLYTSQEQDKQAVLELPEEAPEHFVHYLHFGLTGELLPDISDFDSDWYMNSGTQDVYALLAELFAIGARMEDLRFRNAIMLQFEAIIDEEYEYTQSDRLWERPCAEVVNKLYLNTKDSNSGARRLMVDFYVRSTRTFRLYEPGNICFEFATDLSTALMRLCGSVPMKEALGRLEDHEGSYLEDDPHEQTLTPADSDKDSDASEGADEPGEFEDSGQPKHPNELADMVDWVAKEMKRTSLLS